MWSARCKPKRLTSNCVMDSKYHRFFCFAQLNKTFMGLIFCAAESESTARRRTGFKSQRRGVSDNFKFEAKRNGGRASAHCVLEYGLCGGGCVQFSHKLLAETATKAVSRVRSALMGLL